MSSGAVKAGGEYQGVAGSLEFNLDNFKKSESSRKWNKGKITEYTVGSSRHPEPIRLVLEEIYHVLEQKYWNANKDCEQNDRNPRMELIKRALSEYPDWLHAKPPKGK